MRTSHTLVSAPANSGITPTWAVTTTNAKMKRQASKTGYLVAVWRAACPSLALISVVTVDLSLKTCWPQAHARQESRNRHYIRQKPRTITTKILRAVGLAMGSAVDGSRTTHPTSNLAKLNPVFARVAYSSSATELEEEFCILVAACVLKRLRL